MNRRREARIGALETAAGELAAARAQIGRSIDAADRIAPFERRLARLLRSGPETARGPRPEVEVIGRDVEGRAGRVDRDGYGAAALGGSIHRIKSLDARQVRTATAYGALVEFAAASGGGGPQLGERVDLPAGRDGAGARLRALQAQRLVRLADAAAAALPDLAPSRPALSLDGVREFLADESSGPRRPMPRRALLQAVCVEGWSLGDALGACRWPASDRTRRAAGLALAETLDAVEAAWGGAEAAFVGVDAAVRAKGVDGA